MNLSNRIARTLRARLFPQADWVEPVLARAVPGCALVLCLSLTAAAAGLATPMVTKALIDEGILGGDFHTLLYWAAVSFAIGLATVGFGIISNMQHLRASMDMLGDLRSQVLGAILNRDPTLPNLVVGEAQIRVDGDTSEVQRFLFDSALVAVTACFRLVGGLALMVILDWRLALLPMLTVPLELLFLHWARPGTQARQEDVRAVRGLLNGGLSETLVQLPGLRPLGALGQRRSHFEAQQTDLFSAQTRQRLWSESIGGVSQILSATTRSTVLLVGGWLVIQGHWPMGSLIAFLAYATMMSGPLRNLLGLYHAHARATVALERLNAGIDAALDPSRGAKVHGTVRQIRLDNALPRGARHGPVSLTAEMGEMILLDGPTGVGKSRLLGSLLGDVDLAQGQILLDGHDLTRMSLATRRDTITLVSQRPCQIRGTLQDNLILGQSALPDDTLWSALQTVDLANWANQHQGLDTDLHEMGANMSGGMRQRLALARAILRDGPAILFDESFSEIDTPTCQRILTALRPRLADKICIFVAHAGPVRHLPFHKRVTLADATAIRLVSERKVAGQIPN